MDEEKREKGQKEELGDGSMSRRKFFKKVAYAAPVVMTFIASEAHAVRPTPCGPAHCKTTPCRPHNPYQQSTPCQPNPNFFRR